MKTSTRWTTAALLGASLLLLTSAASAQDVDPKTSPDVVDSKRHIFFQIEAHSSLLSDAPDRSVFSASRGGALRAGYRWKRWGVFGHVEQNRWLTSEITNQLTDGVLNLGVGTDYRIFNDRLRASVTVGSSTLLFDTLLHEAGETGFFMDLRPGGLRWFPTDFMALEFHPLTYSLMIPVVTTPRIAHIQYRTVFIVEFRL